MSRNGPAGQGRNSCWRQACRWKCECPPPNPAVGVTRPPAYPQASGAPAHRRCGRQLAARPGRRRRRTARLPGDHRIRAVRVGLQRRRGPLLRLPRRAGLPGHGQRFREPVAARWPAVMQARGTSGEQAGPARAGSALVRLAVDASAVDRHLPPLGSRLRVRTSGAGGSAASRRLGRCAPPARASRSRSRRRRLAAPRPDLVELPRHRVHPVQCLHALMRADPAVSHRRPRSGSDSGGSRRKALGHIKYADAAMTSHYTHIEAQAHRAAAEMVAKLVERGGIVNGCSPVVPRGAFPGAPRRPRGGTPYQPRPAFMQVAEADGNRTRQRRSAALTGFEDRGDHQVPRRLRVDSTADIRPAQADPQLKATHVFVRLRRHFASSMSRYVGEVVKPRQMPR